MAKLQKSQSTGTETLCQKVDGDKEGCGSEKQQQQHSLWSKLISMDEEYTKKVSVCAKPESSMGHLRPLMILIEISCHGLPWFICTIAGLLIAYKPWEIEILMNLFLALSLDVAVVTLAKVLMRRSRPAHNQKDMFLTVSVDKYSFPSGHASRAAMLLCFFMGKVLSRGSGFVYMLAVWSVIVSLSRVVLGRHHLLDIVFGYIVGLWEYQLLLYVWIPENICVDVLEPYLGHFHL